MSKMQLHRWSSPNTLMVDGQPMQDVYFASQDDEVVMVSLQVLEAMLRELGWTPWTESRPQHQPHWKQALTGQEDPTEEVDDVPGPIELQWRRVSDNAILMNAIVPPYAPYAELGSSSILDLRAATDGLADLEVRYRQDGSNWQPAHQYNDLTWGTGA